jgi:nitrogenase molybdenum-iron protein alpha/beta subunit
VGIPIIAELERSKMFLEAERLGRTVSEAFPDSDITKKFFKLATAVTERKRYTAKFLSEQELESVVLGRSIVKKGAEKQEGAIRERIAVKKCVTRSTQQKEVVHGCAFAGTLCITLSVEGLATVLHAPRDCAHYAVQMVTNALRRSYTNGDLPIAPFARPNVKCSNMNDADMIFGCISSLESDVRGMIEKGNNVIAVATSCPSGIIGEDVEGMISRIKADHPNVTLIPIIEDGNIKGDYMQGATDACIELIRSLAVKGKKERSMNLIGVKTFGINTKSNIKFVTEVLEKMGVRVNCTCVGDTSVNDIRNIPNAELCILMTPDTIAVETMNFMNKEFNLKATENIAWPGMKEAELWIREVGKHFGETKKAEQIVKELRKEFSGRLEMLKDGLKGKKLYIVGMKRDINWIMEAAAGCGMDVVRCVVMDALDRSEFKDLEKEYRTEMVPGGRPDLLKGMKERTERILDPYIPVDPDTDAWIKNDIKEKRPELLLSTYPIDTNVRTCYLPVNPDTTPFAGPDFAATWSRVMRTPAKEGWREDVV